MVNAIQYQKSNHAGSDGSAEHCAHCGEWQIAHVPRCSACDTKLCPSWQNGVEVSASCKDHPDAQVLFVCRAFEGTPLHRRAKYLGNFVNRFGEVVCSRCGNHEGSHERCCPICEAATGWGDQFCHQHPDERDYVRCCSPLNLQAVKDKGLRFVVDDEADHPPPGALLVLESELDAAEALAGLSDSDVPSISQLPQIDLIPVPRRSLWTRLKAWLRELWDGPPSDEVESAPSKPRFERFGFDHPQDDFGIKRHPATLASGTWCCPNCEGDMLGTVTGAVEELAIEGLVPPHDLSDQVLAVHHCLGSELAPDMVTIQEPKGCGYWETAYSPRQQGMGEPLTPERWG